MAVYLSLLLIENRTISTSRITTRPGVCGPPGRVPAVILDRQWCSGWKVHADRGQFFALLGLGDSGLRIEARVRQLAAGSISGGQSAGALRGGAAGHAGLPAGAFAMHE